ncbi:nucleoside phosphorylase domain-containing protein [Aspergillus coremiiformis]|uniref:Nucleoside phosphorylase domain-containing protein n=1 Tax=Aspergillus coremiiformis TaxID=138285 RepID=A0A5N6YZ11_9EURO|nr:nucleoside phosphorylase domain-containing protein [Aspergillus coremiiformis]
MSSTEPSSDPRIYRVGWICANRKAEYMVALAMLDELHSNPLQVLGNVNTYMLGELHGHNVVVCYPKDPDQVVPTPFHARMMLEEFKTIQHVLLVGIGQGVPMQNNEDTDIRLGDVVIAIQESEVIYLNDQFRSTSVKNLADEALRSAANQFLTEYKKSQGDTLGKNMLKTWKHMPSKSSLFRWPDICEDYLFNSAYEHVEFVRHEDSRDPCESCDRDELVCRKKQRCELLPRIHSGVVASLNYPLRDARTRDRMVEMHKKIRCLDMKSAQIANAVGGLVIRGISGYADSHQNEKWQGLAALAAATCASWLLSCLPKAAASKDLVGNAGTI